MIYQVTAQNHAEASENKIHEKTVAARYGFTGGLVPGVAVYGYLTYPVVQELGESWLNQATSDVRFLKPAYQDDQLVINAVAQGEGILVECRNEQDVLLATLSTTVTKPQASSFNFDQSPFQSLTRSELTWANLELDYPFEPHHWPLTHKDNQKYVTQVSDSLTCYESGYLHPHLLLSQANTVLSRKFIMPAWIHVGSHIRVYQAIKESDSILITAKPRKKWQTKGHDFILLDVAYVVNDNIMVEIEHTAIFRIADRS